MGESILDKVENRGIEKGIEKGIEQGKIKGQLEILTSLINKGLITIQQAAKEMGMTVTKFKAAMKEVATN